MIPDVHRVGSSFPCGQLRTRPTGLTHGPTVALPPKLAHATLGMALKVRFREMRHLYRSIGNVCRSALRRGRDCPESPPPAPPIQGPKHRSRKFDGLSAPAQNYVPESRELDPWCASWPPIRRQHCTQRPAGARPLSVKIPNGLTNFLGHLILSCRASLLLKEGILTPSFRFS